MEEAPKKTKEELMAEADNIARNYFRQGLNCSECVLRTFLDMHDSPCQMKLWRLPRALVAVSVEPEICVALSLVQSWHLVS